MKYTVIGLWIEDEPVVAGVVQGESGTVDAGDGEYQRWATYVEADDPEEAEGQAIEDMIAENEGQD